MIDHSIYYHDIYSTRLSDDKQYISLYTYEYPDFFTKIVDL